MATINGRTREMRVVLEQGTQQAHFMATNEADTQISISGPAHIGDDAGFRPMQLVLAALASCASMDLTHILRKQRAELRHLRVIATGTRDADAAPAPFRTITLHFELQGNITDSKARRAVELAVTKYCSVGEMLRHSVSIKWDYRIIE